MGPTDHFDFKTNPMNPRFIVRGTSLERFLKMLDLAENTERTGEDVREIVHCLGDYFPIGSEKENRGATSRQITLMSDLTDLSNDGIRRLMSVFVRSGGLDLAQAHHIIGRLKRPGRIWNPTSREKTPKDR